MRMRPRRWRAICRASDDAFEAEMRGDSGGGDAVLARGFRDDTRLAHFTASKPWPIALFILCAGVEQILTLEVDAGRQGEP
jgi:hypothetical protein